MRFVYFLDYLRKQIFELPFVGLVGFLNSGFLQIVYRVDPFLEGVSWLLHRLFHAVLSLYSNSDGQGEIIDLPAEVGIAADEIALHDNSSHESPMRPVCLLVVLEGEYRKQDQLYLASWLPRLAGISSAKCIGI